MNTVKKPRNDPATSETHRVLFVDDDLATRRSFARIMRQRGIIVDLARTGPEALALATQFPYAVVATDLLMPELDGRALIAQLQEVHPESTYLLVTGADVEDLPQVGQSGLLIRKPWDNQGLGDIVERALRLAGQRSSRSLATVQPDMPGTTRVLLLEDDDIDAEGVRRALAASSDTRYTLFRADTLAHALDALRTQTFGVVLSDLSLPDSKGVCTVASINESAPQTPIVVLSGQADESVALEAVKVGAQDYLLKGQLETTSLRRAIRYAIQRKQSEERLRHMAHYDQLTGLGNRLLLSERLSSALQRATRRQEILALIFLDLDRFKNINDSIGHHAGDELLAEVARRLVDSVRTTDTVTRLGGDEFAIVLEGLTSERWVLLVAQRILAALATPVQLGEDETVASASIGIAFYPENAANDSELLKCADKAMYRAKKYGGNNYQVFSENTHSRATGSLRMENDLRRALETDQFVLHYQPQVSNEDGGVTGVEALLRWQRPNFDLVSPLEFIPLLEETGLIVPVGDWVVHTSCQQLKQWHEQGFTWLRMAVNISARHFGRRDLMAGVIEGLRSAGLSGDSLEIEISESVLIEDTQTVAGVLEELRALGVRIALDDFGTGHSPLAYLKEFTVDTLKIDRAFVTDLPGHGGDRAICSAITALAHGLNLEVVAEGVETAEQLAYLKGLGCTLSQGYLHSRPLAGGALGTWLQQHAIARERRAAA